MGSKKKDLEIICNLQWKNKPHNGGDRSNIIGVYDIPSTTLNWEIFKSYLLKNSGTPDDDVKVSFVPNNEREFPIQSQLDFQIALYAFRKKARNGEIINLKLDRISEQDKLFKKIPTSNDVQTQFDTIDRDSSNSSLSAIDTTPQWFTSYMKEFKKEIINEVSATVSGYISTMKSHGVQSYHSRKSKTESVKRSRKHPLILCEVGNEKEFLKNIKLEKKVDTKLEKLENKSKKLKEKKLALLTKSSDSDAGHSSSKSNSDTLLGVDMNQMNAAPVRYQQSVIPHMVGGEVYLHTWDVINNGSLPWTSDTELHFTWGSASLEPVERIVPCPPLKPGESGSINVLLNVPKICGQYESYWYFHHKGRKFGHWLGCQIIVDKINSAQPLTHSFWDSYEELKIKYDYANSVFETQKDQKTPRRESINKTNVPSKLAIEMENPVVAISDIQSKVKDLKSVEACSSSENDQVENKKKISPAIAAIVEQPLCSSSTDFQKRERSSSSQTEIEEVVLNASPSKIQIVETVLKGIVSNEPSNSINLEGTVTDCKEPKQNKQMDAFLESDDNNNNTEGAMDSSSESISKIDEDLTSNSTFNDMVMINFADEMEDHDTGYAYVLVDGNKVPIPKKYLRSDFLETAEDAPNPAMIIKTNNNHAEVPSSSKDTDMVNVSQCLQEVENITKIKLTSSLSNPLDSSLQNTIPDENAISGFLETAEDASNPAVFAQMKNEACEVTCTSMFIDENNMNQSGEVENITNRESISPMINSCDTSSQITTHAESEISYSFLSQESQRVNHSMQNMPPMVSSSSVEDHIRNGNANSRFFVFPQSNPGFEIVSDHSSFPEIYSDQGCPKKTTQYSFSNNRECNNQFMRCNIYQLDPSDNKPQSENSASCSCHQDSYLDYSTQQNKNSCGSSNEFTFVPNYQQTPAELRPQILKDLSDSKPEQKKPFSADIPTSDSYECTSGSTQTTSKESNTSKANVPQGNIPTPSAPAPMSSVVSGAMTMASSALNTAKNVVNMIIPPRNGVEPGVWINGHWVASNPNTLRESNLQALAEMGFWNRDLNATLLARYNDDISQVISELIL
ncbi:hypothetical protein WA026_012869 [Henosepilachna vigintioctopunctata]|uniref:UBA domain-containing protein n=1 Tax=Henosepilachna vigintioctopunctata TaxID=420089 RepID=A0AAW1TS39_9CUCU